MKDLYKRILICREEQRLLSDLYTMLGNLKENNALSHSARRIQAPGGTTLTYSVNNQQAKSTCEKINQILIEDLEASIKKAENELLVKFISDSEEGK